MFQWIEGFYAVLGRLGYPHPIHPTQVHMVVGRLVGALIFALLARLARAASLDLTARHCFLLGLFFFFPTVVTGLLDWQQFLAGAWIAPIQAKLALSALLLVLLGMGFVLGRGRRQSSSAVLTIYVLCFFSVGALGYLGGSLVYSRTPGEVRDESAQDYAQGRAIFESTCSGCHPGGGNVMDARKPVKGSPMLRDLNVFEHWLRNAAPPMPSYPPGVLTEDQVRDLHNYLTRVLDA